MLVHVDSAVLNESELHPLALEGVLTNRGHARSKADYYAQHLSLRVLCHTIVSDDEVVSSLDEDAIDHRRAASPAPMTPEEEKGIEEKESSEDRTPSGGSAPRSRFSIRKREFGRREWTRDVEESTVKTRGFLSKRFGHRSAVSFIVCFLFFIGMIFIEVQGSSKACTLGRRQGCWGT